ncbi:hypothetical protein PTKIN_Ptkin02bG0064200 [Pterospermum kingtungense]
MPIYIRFLIPLSLASNQLAHLCLSSSNNILFSYFSGDYWFLQNGCYWGLKPLNFMAFTDIWVMCGQRNGYRGGQRTLHSAVGSYYLKRRASGMEYESDWTKHIVSSACTAQVIRSATSLMPWCCKIPIGDGFHEFL